MDFSLLAIVSSSLLQELMLVRVITFHLFYFIIEGICSVAPSSRENNTVNVYSCNKLSNLGYAGGVALLNEDSSKLQVFASSE